MRGSLKPTKRPFDTHGMLRRVRQEVKQFANAAMFDLAYLGFDWRSAICARVSPLKRKLVQSSIGLAPICL
jgi:hypothetical protein